METAIVGWFIPVCGEKKLSVEKMLGLLREDEAIPNWLIPFADDAGGNLFCFSVREEDYGAIYSSVGNCALILNTEVKRMCFCKWRAWRKVLLPNAQRFRTPRIFS